MHRFSLDPTAFLHASALSKSPPSVLPSLLVIILVTAYWLLRSNAEEEAAPYHVALPNETSEQLHEPSLKTPGSAVIQCYAPATGRLLGRVNPHTAEGIDRAVSKAQEAQSAWAQTSWTERRRVLRSLQKSVGFKTPSCRRH